MIRLIACDLDETLLDVNKNIPKANLEAIQKVKAQGIYFVCASGRGYTSMDAVLKQLDSYQKENEYTISNNGGIIVENKDFKHICFHHFSFELANALFTYGMSQDVCVEVFTAVSYTHLDVYKRQVSMIQFLVNVISDAQMCFTFKRSAISVVHAISSA